MYIYRICFFFSLSHIGVSPAAAAGPAYYRRSLFSFFAANEDKNKLKEEAGRGSIGAVPSLLLPIWSLKV